MKTSVWSDSQGDLEIPSPSEDHELPRDDSKVGRGSRYFGDRCTSRAVEISGNSQAPGFVGFRKETH